MRCPPWITDPHKASVVFGHWEQTRGRDPCAVPRQTLMRCPKGAIHGVMDRSLSEPGEYWWRWGRVELPVQSPSSVTSYERVRSFSSTSGAGIGTLP
jgi:hypothetical protein